MTDKKTTNTGTIILGTLIMCLGMQFANYGTALCVSGDVGQMDAMQYYVFIQAIGSIGMMLILPVIGKLTNLMGMRTLVFSGVVLQVIGRALMALKMNWVIYTVGMLIQSIGGGCYISASFVIIAMAVAAEKRAKYFGLIATFNGIGAIVGPILCSMIYSSEMSGMAYFIFVPIVLLGYALAFKGIPNGKQRDNDRFDFAGLFLTIMGILCLLLWMNLSGSGKMFAWTSAPSIICLVVGAVCMVLSIRREITIANPAVPFRMFKNKRLTFAFIGALVQAALSTCTATYAVMWIRINYQGLSGTTLFNGTSTLGQQIVVLIGGLTISAYISAKFVSRFRGAALIAAVSGVLSTLILFCIRFTGTAASGNIVFIGNSDFPVGMIIIYVGAVFAGITSCIAQSTYSAFWQSNAKPEEMASGQALYTFGATGGSAVFGAVVGVVLGTSTDYSIGFLVGLVFAVAGLIAAVIGMKFPKEEIEAAK